MVRQFILVAAGVSLGLAGVGCRAVEPQHDFPFDANGWGGDQPVYRIDPATQEIALRKGMMVRRDFEWAGGEVSFEFRDSRELVWGLVLLDEEFRRERRARLLGPNSALKVGPDTYQPGKKLSPDQYWKLWRADRVLTVEIRADAKGLGYKVLTGWSIDRILENSLDGSEARSTHRIRVKPGVWNRFRAQVVGGEFSYWLNGRPGPGPLKVDPRTHGRLGIFVERGGPLRLRNASFGRASR
jgi:hypothetical protein